MGYLIWMKSRLEFGLTVEAVKESVTFDGVKI